MIKRESGQTVVEYILLLAVAISLVMTFYNSAAYNRLFGAQGSLGMSLKEESEFGYRHAFLLGRTPAMLPPYVGPLHPSYYDDKNNSTRFFGPRDPYQ